MNALHAIPCVAVVRHDAVLDGAPEGFALLWTTARLRFDARQSLHPVQIGEQLQLTIDEPERSKTPSTYILTILEINDTERTHVFELEATRVDLAQHEEVTE
jgi:hypothetical protein